MGKSIVCNNKECYVCKSNYDLHKHHIFYGKSNNRKLSEEYGLWVYLCSNHHNFSDSGVHFDKALDERLKKNGQEAFEEEYGSREYFMYLFGRNYL